MAVRDRHCTVNVAVTVAVPPWVQVTVAVAVPGFVVEPTFHVHETSPSEAAVGVVFNPAAADTVPDGQVTFAAHVAPTDVRAVMVAGEPWIAGLGRLTNVTENDANGGALVTFGVGATITGGVVAPVANGMP